MTFIDPTLCHVVGGGADATAAGPQGIGFVLVDFPMPTCPVAVRPPAD